MQFNPHKITQVLNNECVRCSLASLLGLAREDVPNFMDTGSWYQPMQSFLKERDLEFEILHHSLKPDADFYLGQGVKGDTGHCVVMHNGEIWHDPSNFGIDKFEAWIVVKKRNPLPVFYASMIEQVRTVARTCGYALGLHGSLCRDLDLIAVPWVDDAKSPDELVKNITANIEGFRLENLPDRPEPKLKPHGRVSYTIYFDPRGFIDLSVMPLKA